ncbi:Nucleic acid-binding protein [Corchorus capsularis]|uniref:Nucleic acid-binding protein n=1 Tax=Corchorus capsularis TaxID=210143 RepID=A0A1R3J8I8_COCAP|nr:Nucleic acid-binding protein [Corchorus capsularis]
MDSSPSISKLHRWMASNFGYMIHRLFSFQYLPSVLRSELENPKFYFFLSFFRKMTMRMENRRRLDGQDDQRGFSTMVKGKDKNEASSELDWVSHSFSSPSQRFPSLDFTGVGEVITELTEGIEMFPPRYFLFASIEQIRARSTSDKLNVSGHDVRITVWSQFLQTLNLDSLKIQQPKPILIVAATTTKIISDTHELRERFKDEKSVVEIVEDTHLSIPRDQLYKNAAQSTIIEPLGWKATDIDETKFNIHARVTGIDTSSRWYYPACGSCSLSLCNIGDNFYFADHKLQSPHFTVKIPLLVTDTTTRLKVMVFGDVAMEMTSVKLANTSALRQAAVRRNELGFKVFDFTLLSGTQPGDEPTKENQIECSSAQATEK